MKGKLAYFFLFFIAWFVIDSIFILRKMGAKGIRRSSTCLSLSSG
jgi:phosphate transport system permease protein